MVKNARVQSMFVNARKLPAARSLLVPVTIVGEWRARAHAGKKRRRIMQLLRIFNFHKIASWSFLPLLSDDIPP